MYRFCWIGAGDKILVAANFDCGSDEAAEAKARAILGSYQTIEVWDDARIVVRVSEETASQLLQLGL
jgi:hypothetical protein